MEGLVTATCCRAYLIPDQVIAVLVVDVAVVAVVAVVDSYAGDMYPESVESFQRVHRQVGLHKIWMYVNRSGCDVGIWGKIEASWPELFHHKVYLFSIILFWVVFYILIISF
jgi:hypothetical protein